MKDSGTKCWLLIDEVIQLPYLFNSELGALHFISEKCKLSKINSTEDYSLYYKTGRGWTRHKIEMKKLEDVWKI